MKENGDKVKISAVAITYNEQDNIERYIKDLSFADEIIIVDSYSTDQTVALASKYNVSIHQRIFDDFSSQKNYAISLAKNDWILFFDLDEVINVELKEEIIKTVNSNYKNVAYYARRNFYFLDKKLHYSSWQRDKVIRVFNKNYCSYVGLVHEVIKAKGKIGYLENRLDHHSYKSFDLYNQKLSMYSKLQATALYSKNVRPNAYHFFIRPFYRFINQYVFRLGFLDGVEGFIVSYIHAFAVFKRYLQLWMMYRKID